MIFRLNEEKSYVLLNYNYPTNLVFELKKKYFMLWTKIEYYCLLAFVKSNLSTFCLLVLSPWEFFCHYVWLSQNEFESLYDRANHWVSNSVNHCVFYVLSESHWKPEKKVGFLSMIKYKMCFPPWPFWFAV